ncbi:MAG: MBL fold metallo-hydrolase [Lachnospiraceae bacterium]|nr:MBL fold metallo-hydrolase [Lachnospiraceae bacterium]
MQVIFIHHSCFLVEVDDKVLIFDYFNGDRVNGYQFTGRIPSYAPETPIYMFASHKHQDHFDMDILRWSSRYPNIRYILSKDIRISPHFLEKHGIDPKVRERVKFVTPGNHYEVDNLSIETLNSTDAGVAYYVTLDGVSLFHAGDLNDWKMEGAGDLINGKQERAYRHEIQKLSDKPINLAFVPLDPRLGEHRFLGIDYFLKNTDAEYVFPMHMWQDYSSIREYKKKITNLGMAERVMEIERENQVFPFGEL